ncbi:diguanylate cyclase domain-containing protein [Piscinibacter terrae]|uniref:Diguanylate cyclase n=1 Tax=Piscinibacter terrae TaxID=2496871 RepID=A0A3N7HSG5_9BURK|nr:diguanylate cyclase [Albitalea terrae]RQP23771.1 diguanylate cyclase [Albitalea terrae]
MKLGLHIRLGALLAAFGVLATGLTGLYSYTQSRELLVKAAERDLMSSVQMFSRRFATAVHNISDDVRLVGELEVTRSIPASSGELAEAGKTSLADTFHALLRANPAYFQVRLISARDHGLELVRVDREGQGTVRVLGDMLQEKAHFPYVFNALALKPGEVFLSKIGVNHDVGSHAALNRPAMYISSPVTTPDGMALGLVVITVDITRVFDELKADLPTYRKLFIANEWGDYLVHPDPAQAFGFDQGRRVLIQESIAQVQPLLDGKAQQVLAQAELGDKPEPALGAFMRMPLGRDEMRSFVVLGIAEPLSEILESTRTLARTTLQIVLGFSAIAIVLALFAARVVTRPLNQMTQEVRRFSSDRPVGDLPTQRQDEIGELARGFDEMQRRISLTMSELDASRTHLAHMARHDNLTGLANRSVFIDRLEHAILTAKRSGGCLAVLFVDLDRFKHINDTYGHGVGDVALVQAARLLTSSVREVDTVARWGGDEFVILLEAMDEEHEARRVAQTLLDRFGRRMDVSGHALDLGVSIGISMYPRDGFEASELIQRADEAMYLAKHRQGNRYSVFGNESLT